MATVTLADLAVDAPELAAAVSAGDFAAALADAQARVNDRLLGAKAFAATKYLTAHLLAQAHPELSQATRVRAWEVERGADAGEYGLTRYGLKYHQLIKTTVAFQVP